MADLQNHAQLSHSPDHLHHPFPIRSAAVHLAGKFISHPRVRRSTASWQPPSAKGGTPIPPRPMHAGTLKDVFTKHPGGNH